MRKVSQDRCWPTTNESTLITAQHLPYVTASRRRQVLERGLQDLERRSRDVKTLPERFVITSLDAIIHEDLKLGSGGYSQVYMGSWHGTKVAVKVLEKGLSQSVRPRQKFPALVLTKIIAAYG